MTYNVLYFGMIAEALTKHKETLHFENTVNVREFREFIKKQYSKLDNMSFQLAINKKITPEETTIEDNSEIAILPPFAGG